MDYDSNEYRYLLSDELLNSSSINNSLQNKTINKKIDDNNYQLMDDINNQLMKYINKNDIMDILKLFKKYNNKIDLNYKDNDKNTFLMLVIKKIKPKSYITLDIVCPIIRKKILDITDICDLFIKNELNINNQNIYGENALFFAIEKLQFIEYNDDTKNQFIIYKLIELLINNHIDINLANNKGYNSLMYCILLTSGFNKKQSNNIIQLLLKHNVKINHFSNDGKSALELALNNPHIYFETIKLFLDEEPNTDFINNFTNLDLLVKLGDIYKTCGNIDKMKECFIRAINLDNLQAKIKLFYYYYSSTKPEFITKDESILINNLFKTESAFVILLKSKHFHTIGECFICMEESNNIIKLPCHNNHLICLNCIYKLKKNVCPFCGKKFPRNINELVH